MYKFNELEKVDSDFLAYIANNGNISIDNLYKVLMFSDSAYVEHPLDDTEYPDINDGYELKYRFEDEFPIRISNYGEEIDFAFAYLDLSDNRVCDGRLTGLTVDFGLGIIKDPNKLFEAINSALKIYGGDLVLTSLCFCSLQEELFPSLSATEKISFKAPLLEVKLAHLEELVLNRVRFSDVKFIAAPRLKSISVIDAGVARFDLTKLYNLVDFKIGDCEFSHLVLPVDNAVKK